MRLCAVFRGLYCDDCGVGRGDALWGKIPQAIATLAFNNSFVLLTVDVADF